MWMWILLGAAITPYIILPLLIKSTQRFKRIPQLRKLSSAFYPSSVNAFFETVDKDLSKEAFYVAFDAVSTEYQGLKMFLRYYISEQEKIHALATALVADDEPQKSARTVIEFSSFFTDGSKVSTNNSDLPEVPLHPKFSTTRTLYFIRDAVSLLNAHRHYIARTKAIPFVPQIGQEFDFFKERLIEELAEQEKIGGLLLDDEKREYRPTWAGAFLMAWYTMWPLSFIRRQYAKQKAKLSLRQLPLAKG